MMGTSARHQKQKLTRSKPHPFARSIVRQFTLTSRPTFKKRFGLVGVGLVAGIGVPALALAAQPATSDSQKSQTNGSTTVRIDSSSSAPEEVLRLEQDGSTQSDTSPSNSTHSSSASVSVNGESIPVPQNGSVIREVSGNSSSQTVDVNVTIDHTSSSSSSTNTDVHIDSSSRYTTDDNLSRGSPRR